LLCGTALSATLPAQAANWLMLQGTEPVGSADAANIWGFIQPEYQYSSGTKLGAGPWKDQDAAFNQIGPDLESSSQFNLRRARLGVRGVAMPIDDRINYFLLAEFGNNAITAPGGGLGSPEITDASVTLNYIDGARVRLGQFKYPGAEEGLAAIHVFNYINFTNATNTLLLERFFDEDGSRGGTDSSVTNEWNGPAGAFRDIGIQLFDTFKTGDWEHTYAGMIGNGNGIARGDNNSDKDWYLYWSSEQVYGGKGPRREGLKLFGWYHDGVRTLDYANGVAGEQDFDRTRWGLGTTFLKGPYRFAAEYIAADGMIYNGTDGGAVPGNLNNAGTQRASFNILPEDKADGFYVDFGYRILPDLELDLRYDRLNRATDTDAGERRFETWTIGAQYFLNKKTRVLANYEIRSAEAPELPGSAAPNQILDGMDDRFSIQLLAIF